MVPIIPLIAILAAGAGNRVKLSGWLVFDDEGTSLKCFREHADCLQSVSVDWYKCNSKGVGMRQPRPTPAEKKEILAIAKKHKVKLYALIANPDFQPQNVEVAMASPASLKAHADSLAKLAVEDGIDGIDLDYESLPAKDRDRFSSLVKTTADACHAKGLQLVIAVHPKESEPGNWDGPQAQDFAAIGKAADYVRVMTYDFHWETGDAGPIGPPDWVDRVMTFAASEIPASKLDLGIPAYGYDWLGKKAASFGWDGWLTRVKAHGAAKRDSASHELTMSYDGRTAFFADGEASRPKFPIVRKLQLNGLAMWRLGSEDPSFWPLYKALAK